jgi:hypothetical protein
MIPPPNNWTWVGGVISHFNMEKKLRKCLPKLFKAEDDGTWKPAYIHGSKSSELPQDESTFDFLSEREDREFEYPLELRGKNSSCIAISFANTLI